MIEEQTEEFVIRQVKYESGIDLSSRKDLGIYFTNNVNTVDNILDIIDFDSEDILKKKVLEPSCGNGIFVIRFLEKLIKLGISENDLAEYIHNNLFYNDIDEKMVNVTTQNIQKIFLSHFGNSYKGEFNAYVFDFTLRIKPRVNSLFDTILNVPLAELLEKIDYIIGNPPYVTLYGRRDRKKDEAQRVYYLSRYSQFPNSLKNGKINFVMLFLEQSIDLLKSGGKLSFIIDLAFFETAYEYTRKYLLDNTRILRIEYNIKDFEVASGQVIIKIQKENVKNNIVSIIDAESKNTTKIDQAKWNTPNDQYRFKFNLSSDNQQIINKIKEKKCKTLKDLYPKKNLRTCIMVLNMENLFVFENQKKELNVPIYPYYQGSKGLSEKYGKLNHILFFHYNKQLQDYVNDELKIELKKKGVKNKKRLGLGETIIYDNPKVYIRQSAKEIIASFDSQPSAANNSLYVFSLRNNSDYAVNFLKYLTGLLNSELITFYAQQEKIIRYSKGKQPQIKTSDLYTIPIPEDKNLQANIAILVDKVYLNNGCEVEAKKEIDELLFNYFNIEENEITKLRESIESF